MCGFGEWAEWRSRIIAISYYIDIDNRKEKFRPLNPTPLDFITG